MGINRDAWLKAIQDTKPAVTDDPDAMTSAEFAALYHCGYVSARVRLKKLQSIGTVEMVTKWITDSVGRQLRVPAWRLLTKEVEHARNSVAGTHARRDRRDRPKPRPR